MKDNKESLTNHRIRQILAGNTSPNDATKARQRRKNTATTFELLQQKRTQLSGLPKEYELGPKLKKDELREVTSKLTSIAKEYFGNDIKTPRAEFTHRAFDKTIEFARHKIWRNPWIRYIAAISATVTGASQLTNLITFQQDNSGNPLIGTIAFTAGLLTLTHTLYNHKLIKNPYFELPTIRIPNQRREIVIPNLAYNIAKFINPQQGQQYSAFRHGIAEMFKGDVAKRFAEEEGNENFLRGPLEDNIRALDQCYQWLTNGKPTTNEANGSVLFQLYKTSGNSYEEIFHYNLDLANNLKPKKEQKPRGAKLVWGIENYPKNNNDTTPKQPSQEAE